MINKPFNIRIPVTYPTGSSSPLSSSAVDTLCISSFTNFDYSQGVNATVKALSKNKLRTYLSVPITGSLWQNWPNNQTETEDTQYLVNCVCTTLNVIGGAWTSGSFATR